MICARFTYEDHQDIVELDPSGMVEVDDPNEVRAISFCGFASVSLFEREYAHREEYYLVDMDGIEPMPNLKSLLFSRVIVQGLDSVLRTSNVGDVKARLWCDEWFVCPKRYGDDKFTLYGGCYDMAKANSGEIVAHGISYLRAPELFYVDIHGEIKVIERDFPSSRHAYAEVDYEINPRAREKDAKPSVARYRDHDEFLASMRETVWEHLNVTPPPWDTRAKSARSAV